MKYPEYDSPFEIVMSDITTKMAQNIDEMSWQAVQRVGINVNKDKLLLALEYDSARYREAYKRGRETGYTGRDEEIVRCKDCKHFEIKDHWADWNGVPILATSDCPTCNKWADGGCKTDPEGFCFLAERVDT